ncbi:hypothetical protein PR048_027591 [Dryococelus australis]|uniref:Uncharacterized protein n=1 Tax=Dryococelus australis TaxID=614101 RepID=A0ABQ9GGZ7_9NEOP|nr:hypothetical protein PR048_027591 [Dryococelus australis]
MASGFSDEFRIPKLNSDNYFAWAALQQKGCWEAIEPGYGEEEVLTAKQNDSNVNALSFILLIVSDDYLNDIGECTSVKEAWQVLEEIHSRYVLLHQIMFGRELMNLRKTADMSNQEYMSKIQDLNHKVTKSGMCSQTKYLLVTKS